MSVVKLSLFVIVEDFVSLADSFEFGVGSFSVFGSYFVWMVCECKLSHRKTLTVRLH